MIQVFEFSLSKASERDLAEYHQMFAAAYAVDRPREPVPAFEAAIGHIQSPLYGSAASLHWAARVDGRLYGLAKVGLPNAENAHLAFIQIRVHPERRHEGVGKALLREAVRAIHAEGRPLITAWGVTAESDAEAWAKRLGAKAVHRDVLQILDLKSADQSLWDVSVHTGYSLTRWIGATPDDLLETFANARSAIHDAPTHESSKRLPMWTAERVRQEEQSRVDRGVEQRVVAAIVDSTNEVAGLTVLELHAHRPEDGFQHDTAVLVQHRGRGLGLAMKAEMLRWLAAERPIVRRIGTSTADDNVHMIRVNLQLGFETQRKMVDFEIASEYLLTTLGG